MQWDLKTFPELWRLATKVPSAGIHVVDTILYNRKKDVEGATGSWFAGLLSESPWFKDTMPDVRSYSFVEPHVFTESVILVQRPPEERAT